MVEWKDLLNEKKPKVVLIIGALLYYPYCWIWKYRVVCCCCSVGCAGGGTVGGNNFGSAVVSLLFGNCGYKLYGVGAGMYGVGILLITWVGSAVGIVCSISAIYSRLITCFHYVWSWSFRFHYIFCWLPSFGSKNTYCFSGIDRSFWFRTRS